MSADRIRELQALVYVPGLWRCAKCNFRLVQSVLNAFSGAVTANDKPGDKCPNCNVPLWRVSEREYRQEMQADVEKYFLEADAAKRIIAEMKKGTFA